MPAYAESLKQKPPSSQPFSRVREKGSSAYRTIFPFAVTRSPGKRSAPGSAP